MSKELKRRGFRFVGPTTCYALMQAAGLVNDHHPTCFRAADPGPPAGPEPRSLSRPRSPTRHPGAQVWLPSAW